MASNDGKVLLLEGEIEQLKLQLSEKDSKLADISQKAKAAINKLKGEIASLQANGAPPDVASSDSAQKIQELIKARDDALEEVSKVKEQAKKHLQKIKAQHAEEMTALRQSIQNSGTESGEGHTDVNVKNPNTDQELTALKEELAKVDFVIFLILVRIRNSRLALSRSKRTLRNTLITSRKRSRMHPLVPARPLARLLRWKRSKSLCTAR
jgi:hypothetical protein